MLTTLEKVKCLEEYLALENSFSDSVLDRAITKIIVREHTRMEELKIRLAHQINEFEQRYHLLSADFYPCYEQGKM